MRARKASALELDEPRVPRQVEGQQDGISDVQVLASEAGLRLVGLDTTKGCELRVGLCGLHDGVRTLLADAVPQHAVLTRTKGQSRTSVRCVMRKATNQQCQRLLTADEISH